MLKKVKNQNLEGFVFRELSESCTYIEVREKIYRENINTLVHEVYNNYLHKEKLTFEFCEGGEIGDTSGLAGLILLAMKRGKGKPKIKLIYYSNSNTHHQLNINGINKTSIFELQEKRP